MRGGDHNPDIGAQAACQHGDGWGRQRPDDGNVHSGANEAGSKRRFDQVAGYAGVLADQHTVTVVAPREQKPRGLAEPQRHFRRHRIDIGLTANAVGSK